MVFVCFKNLCMHIKFINWFGLVILGKVNCISWAINIVIAPYESWLRSWRRIITTNAYSSIAGSPSKGKLRCECEAMCEHASVIQYSVSA